MRSNTWFLSCFLLLLVACQAPRPPSTTNTSESEAPQSPPQEAPQSPPQDVQITDGQTVYVPVYSHVRWQEDKNFPLSITLSVHNTDPERAISLVDVSYYDTDGGFVESYLNEPRSLPPLATAEYFIGKLDMRGGSGANFIVRWEATGEVYEPVVEAVMLTTAGTQGISFITEGRVYQRSQ
jgi:hypothetical protein